MLMKKALKFATKAHAGQFRKDNTPYIMHPVAVALAAGEWGLPREIQQVALLHDVLEDTSVTKQEVVDNFGDYVADVVVQLTNPSNSAEHKMKSRAERKRIDREHLAKVSQYAKILKMLDRIDNLQDLNSFNLDFQRLYIDETKELFKVLQDAHWRIANTLMEEIVRAEGYNK